jgi:hypothetical protein
MRLTAILAGLGAIAMLVVISYGFIVGDFGGEGRQLLGMPWGIVSLVDLYVGFLLFSVWILFREGSSLRSWIWIGLVMVLGSLTICLYVLAALRASRGDWSLFFLGHRARSST